MIRRFLSVSLLPGLLVSSLAWAVPVQLKNMPLTLEPNATLLTLKEEGIRTAFPSAAGRPDVVFLTADRKVSVAFEWRSSKLATNEVEKLVSQFPAVIRSQVPNVKTLKSELVQIGPTPWAQFVFTTPSTGDDLRRELLVTSMGGRMLVVTIAGNMKDYSRNEAVVRNLANSVRLN